MVFEAVSHKVGAWCSFVLGLMHFFNLFVLTRMRRRMDRSHLPPVEPDELLGGPPTTPRAAVPGVQP